MTKFASGNRGTSKPVAGYLFATNLLNGVVPFVAYSSDQLDAAAPQQFVVSNSNVALVGNECDFDAPCYYQVVEQPESGVSGMIGYSLSGGAVYAAERLAFNTGTAESNPELQLRHAIMQIFLNAEFSREVETDPEEGWTRDVLLVSTGVPDFDDRFALEQQFYSVVRADAGLGEQLRKMSVVFE